LDEPERSAVPGTVHDERPEGLKHEGPRALVADGNDDVPFLVLLRDIQVGLYDLLQRVAPVDDGLEPARLRQLAEQRATARRAAIRGIP
jgi:hypothetical protein